MDGIDKNPWNVTNLDEFMYYCCPECEERNESEDRFLKHALDEHPEAQKYLQKFTVKKELISNQNPDISEDFIECEPGLGKVSNDKYKIAIFYLKENT